MRLTERDMLVIHSKSLEFASAYFPGDARPDKREFLDYWEFFERGLIEGPAAIRDTYVNPPAGATVLTVVK